MNLREQYRQNNKYGLDGGKRRTPSPAYHKFFEGYKEKYSSDSAGKKKHIERVYTAELYRKELSAKKLILLKALFVFLFLSALVAHGSTAVRPLLMNYTWYVVLPQALVILAAILTACSLFSYVSAPYLMTVDECRSARRIEKFSAAMSICCGLAALSEALYLVLNPYEESAAVLLCITCELYASAALLAVNRTERRIGYVVMDNPTASDQKGEVID